MAYNRNKQTYTFKNGSTLKAFNTMNMPAMYYLQAQGEITGLTHGLSILEMDKYLKKINEIAIASTDNVTEKLSQIVTLTTLLNEKKELFMNQYNVLRIASFYFYLNDAEIENHQGQSEELIAQKTSLMLADNEALFFFIQFVKKKLTNLGNITDKDFQLALSANTAKMQALEQNFR